MVQELTGTKAMGARVKQIVAEHHPERFTYDGHRVFLDGLPIGDVLTKALQSDQPMTNKRALEEIEAAKEIIDRHAGSGWLASYGHNLDEGFFYAYWEGSYEQRAMQEVEGV